MTDKWTREDALALCRCAEAVAPTYGAHVALTGGLLYKDGERKDCDILFYCIRQVDAIDIDGLLVALELIGLVLGERFGWVQKATWNGKAVDMFFPEAYPASSAQTPAGGY